MSSELCLQSGLLLRCARGTHAALFRSTLIRNVQTAIVLPWTILGNIIYVNYLKELVSIYEIFLVL